MRHSDSSEVEPSFARREVPHNGHVHASGGRSSTNGHTVATVTASPPPLARDHVGPVRPLRRLGAFPTLDSSADARELEVAPDWDRLQPRGFYAARGKRLANLAMLLLTFPFALALALPIALVNWAIFRDLGAIFYRQPRVGRHGRLFSIYKFRTMREVAGPDFDSWKNGDEGPRVTPFGRFLRNTHLDELPQLFNVLRGEMDFVGPRPEMVEIDTWACRRIEGFHERYALLPGITGFAQITLGYAGMDTDAYCDKLAADLHYCRNLSLRLDVEILVRTALWMLRGRGWRHQVEPDQTDPYRESSTV